MVASIGTSNTAVGSNDNSQDQPKKILTLWTQDVIACQPLAGFFHIATLGSEQRSGEHVITLEKEREIRLLARILSATGKTVSVFVCHDPPELSIHSMGHNAVMMILQQKLSYAEWLDFIKEAPLSLEHAVAIAEDIMQSQPESLEHTIALEKYAERKTFQDKAWKPYLNALSAMNRDQLNGVGDIDFCSFEIKGDRVLVKLGGRKRAVGFAPQEKNISGRGRKRTQNQNNPYAESNPALLNQVLTVV